MTIAEKTFDTLAMKTKTSIFGANKDLSRMKFFHKFDQKYAQR